ncbi:MAG: hypothetical protein HPY50_22045 [Firmicutes bacterium]|nr:hypothetical protein [Bacillota bacterium]
MLTMMERLLILIKVVIKGQERIGAVGHTLVQKLIYLLQAGKAIPLGYKFRLYHYGPYCAELWGDLNSLKEYGFLSIIPKPNGLGYDITVTTEGKRWLAGMEGNQPSEIGLEEKVEDLLDLIGGEPVRKLEVLATTHYVCSDWKRKGILSTDENIIASVLNLKPHLTASEIESAIKILKEKNLY